jgi:hypothetical protein
MVSASVWNFEKLRHVICGRSLIRNFEWEIFGKIHCLHLKIKKNQSFSWTNMKQLTHVICTQYRTLISKTTRESFSRLWNTNDVPFESQHSTVNVMNLILDGPISGVIWQSQLCQRISAQHQNWIGMSEQLDFAIFAKILQFFRYDATYNKNSLKI